MEQKMAHFTITASLRTTINDNKEQFLAFVASLPFQYLSVWHNRGIKESDKGQSFQKFPRIENDEDAIKPVNCKGRTC